MTEHTDDPNRDESLESKESEESEETVSRLPTEEWKRVDQRRTWTRRAILGTFAGILGMAVLHRFVGDGEKPEKGCVVKEVEIQDDQRLEFMGEEVVIRPEKLSAFNERILALQKELLLRFSKRKKVHRDKDHSHGEERNDEYWARAVEEDFHKALLRVTDYQPILEEAGASYDVPPDMGAVFFIESGFEPGQKSRTGYYGIPQMNKFSIADAHELITTHWDTDDRSPAISAGTIEKLNDPWIGIHNGAAYLRILHEKLPKDRSLKSFLRNRSAERLIVRGLHPYQPTDQERTELEDIENELGITEKDKMHIEEILDVSDDLRDKQAEKDPERIRFRMKHVIDKLFEEYDGEDLLMTDPWGYTVASYNFGTENLARLIFRNLLSARRNGERLGDHDRMTVGNKSGIQKVALVDLDLSFALRESDSEETIKERENYYPMAVAAQRLLTKWNNLNSGEVLSIHFKTSAVDPEDGRTKTYPKVYTLVKP